MSEKQFDALLSALQSMDAKFDRRFDIVDERLDVVDKRLDAMENRLDAVEGRLDKIEDRLDKVEVQLVNVNGELKKIERWMPYDANQDVMDRLAILRGY